MTDYRLGARGLFGAQATETKVKKELLGYSDYELHSFALDNGERFSSYILKEEHLFCSAKCRFLAKLLPDLKVLPLRPGPFLCGASEALGHGRM